MFCNKIKKNEYVSIKCFDENGNEQEIKIFSKHVSKTVTQIEINAPTDIKIEKKSLNTKVCNS